MAKDPAFLFYPGDWLGGTMGMTFEEKGAYMELLIFQFNRGAFNKKKALMCLQGSGDLWNILKDKFEVNENGLFFNEKLKEEQEKRKAYTESRRKSREKSDEDSVRMYVVRDNIRETYKIGTSVNPVRRYNELSNQNSPAIMMTNDVNKRDLTLIWYSGVIKRTEEKIVHQHFNNQRITGEWFNLSDLDINYLYKTYGGTYAKRTEDANENEDANNSNKGINSKKFEIPSLEMIVLYAKPLDINKEICEAYYNSRMATNWKRNKQAVENWEYDLQGFVDVWNTNHGISKNGTEINLMPNYYSQKFEKTLHGDEITEYHKHLKSLGWVSHYSGTAGTTWNKPKTN